MVENHNEILVSIIIPVHKTHSFFISCVESALSQTHKNIEVILACNGNLEINECKKFLDINDHRLVFIKTIQGRDNARNCALEIAKGNWIQFLDYDDYLFPAKIEKQLNEVMYDYKLIICEWKKFTKDVSDNYNFPFKSLFTNKLVSANKLIQKLGQSGGFIATSSWLVSKELLSELKWQDSPNDDAVFLSEILKKEPRIIMIPEVLSAYRIHESNTSSIRNKEEFDKLMKSWKVIYHNLKKIKDANVEVYIYKSYLYLIGYSKQIDKYRLQEVVYNCICFGLKGKVGFVMLKDIIKKIIR